MSTPYIGEIRMFGGNFAPAGWEFCNGQLLAIAENDTLFQLIGTTYGGDGQSTFALPDLRGRNPIHAGSGFVLAQQAGVETVALTTAQIPQHSHTAQAAPGPGNAGPPTNAVWAQSALNQFSSGAGAAPMNAAAIQPAGGSQPHDNMMPFLAVSFIISLFGIFPSQN